MNPHPLVHGGGSGSAYTYDAWGNMLSRTMLGSNLWSLRYNIAESNPFLYRGYYYDRETGFYYLRSRYYDPVIGRFINADSYVNANGDLIGYNMYAYCSNNPVMIIHHPKAEGCFQQYQSRRCNC